MSEMKHGTEVRQVGMQRWRTVQRLPRLIALGVVLACALVASSNAAAGASTYDARGEWEVTIICSCSPEPVGAIALITKMEADGEFSGTTSIDKIFPGTLVGTLNQSNDSLTLVVKSETPSGQSTFTMTSGSGNPATNEMSGTGYFEGGGTTGKPSGTLTGKRLRSFAEVEAEKEKLEKEEKEARQRQQEAKERVLKEKEAQEAKEAKEREEKEIAKANEAKVAKEREEKQAKEAREAQEAKERQEKVSREADSNQSGPPSQAVLSPAALITKSAVLSASGVVSLDLSNANGSPISGQLTLTGMSAVKAGTAKAGIISAQVGGVSHASAKATVLGEASFTIPASGRAVVKLKLSRGARATILHRGKLQVTLKIVTGASGQAPVTKVYSLTLLAALHKHR
jgi:hypothetical protein